VFGIYQGRASRCRPDEEGGSMAATAEYDEIARVVQLYVDGMGQGDVDKLTEAFHPDSRMFGLESGDRFENVPIAEFIDFASTMPADTGDYQGRIVSVTQVGNAAVALVVVDGAYGDVSYADFLSLLRVLGVWKIVNKNYVSTAGVFPSEVRAD
jgi:hypothetical protein